MGSEEKPPESIILSIDPGEKRIGVCMFKYFPERKKADLRIKNVIGGPEDLYSFLVTAMGLGSRITHIVCENYRIRPPEQTNFNPRSKSPYGRSQSGPSISAKDFWSEVRTIRVIGACEFFAMQVGAEFVTQEPKDVLAQGRKWVDFKVSPNPKIHIDDDIAAYIHGAYFMMKRRMIMGVDDIAKFGQEKMA